MLASTDRKIQYALSYPFSSTFPIPFKFWQAAELTAVLSFPAGTDDQELTLSTDYTLSAPGDTGTLTKVSDWNHAAAALTIYRTVDLTQATDYRNGEAVDMDILEKDFDLSAARDQQIEEQSGRQISIPITDPAGNFELPAKGARASTILGFDADGNIIPAAGGVISATPFMATVLDDLDAASAKATLGVSADIEAAINNTLTIQNAVVARDVIVRNWSRSKFYKAGALTQVGTPVSTGVTDYESIPIYLSDTQILIILHDSAGKIRCSVVTIDADTGVLSFGTWYDAESSGFTTACIGSARLSATKVILTYGSAGNQYTRIANVSGTAVSFGARSSAFSTTATKAMPIRVSGTRFAVAYTNGSTTFWARLCDIDGSDNITLGTEQTIASALVNSFSVSVFDSAKLIFLWTVISTKACFFRVYSYTDINTFTAGTAKNWATGALAMQVPDYNLTPTPSGKGALLLYTVANMDEGLYVYRFGRFVPYPISTVLDAVEIQLATLQNSLGDVMRCFIADDGGVVLYGSSSASAYATLFLMASPPFAEISRIQGYVASHTIAIETTASAWNHIVPIGDRDRAVFVYRETGTNLLKAVPVIFRSRVIGFASEVISGGNSGKIKTAGALGGFSNLVPGRDYYLALDGTIALEGIQRLGRAIDATTLKIEIEA